MTPDPRNVKPSYPSATAEKSLNLENWSETPTASGFLDESLQIQAVLVMLAAQQKKPDALAKGDALATKFNQQGIWSLVDVTLYRSKPPEERLAWWASGAALKLPLFTEDASWGPQISGGVLDQWIIDKVKSLYEAVYGESTNPDWLRDLTAAAAAATKAANPSSNVGLIIGVTTAVVIVGGGVTYIVLSKQDKDKKKHKRESRGERKRRHG